MALIGEANDPRLLVLMATGDAWLFDALTSRATRISLAEPGVTTPEPAPNRIYLFEAQGPGDPRSRPRALLLGQGNARRTVTFLELERLEEQRSKNLDLRPMGAPAQSVHFFPQQGIALVQHAQVPGVAGGAGFSVIDLARRTVAPIFASLPVERITLGTAAGGATMKPGKVWIAPARGGGELDSHLGFLDLGSFSPGDVRLDARVGQILPLGSGSDGKRRVLVDHGLVAGHVTVIDADDPKRATARSVTGFMLNDLLQRGAR
jgi:hypothetical protein